MLYYMSTTKGVPMLTITDYYAPWCGPCKTMEPILESLVEKYQGKVNLVKVNIDEEPDKGQAAGVMSIPTMIIGEERLVGYTPKEKLEQLVDSLLQNQG
jgi:thioredoxin 1